MKTHSECAFMLLLYHPVKVHCRHHLKEAVRLESRLASSKRFWVCSANVSDTAPEMT